MPMDSATPGEPDLTKVKTEHALESYKSLITLSIEAYKFLAAANGGAAIALLAYLGNVAAKVDCSSHKPVIPDMRWAMGLFLLGLVLCGSAMGFGYRTQFGVYNTAVGRPILHGQALRLTVACAILSLIAFGVGCVLAVFEFR